MNNTEIILDKVAKAEKGLFNLQLTEDVLLNGYLIKKYRTAIAGTANWTALYTADGKLLRVDDPGYITEYAPALLDQDFNSILVGGLGLGSIPYVVQDFAQVDVVEIDQNIIDIVNQLGHLTTNVNIIKDDIFTFTTEKTYDIVLLDIWYEPLTIELSDQLIQKYLPLVKTGGFLYIPINARSLDDKVKIYPTATVVTP
jgi:hypothetical protein